MKKNNSFRPDFGIYLKNTFGGNKNSGIQILNAFVIENLVMFPNKKSSITGRVDEKVVSFDFEDNILKIFLKILTDLKVVDRLDIDNRIREQQDQPISFTVSPVLVAGMVLSCKFAQVEKSETTDEEFLPLIIESAKIVQEPVAVLLNKPQPFNPLEFPTLVKYDSQKIENAIQSLMKSQGQSRQQALVNLETDLYERDLLATGGK